MSEREQSHRHAMEAQALAAETTSIERAQSIELWSRIAGGGLLSFCLAGAILLAFYGFWQVALGLVGVPVMGAIGWLFRRHPKRNGS
jgi:uncharacterized membrane protein